MNRAVEIVEVKVCLKCQRKVPDKNHKCPYCGGELTIKYIAKKMGKLKVG